MRSNLALPVVLVPLRLWGSVSSVLLLCPPLAIFASFIVGIVGVVALGKQGCDHAPLAEHLYMLLE
eukprot:scaffold3158_cov389-Prasinococcus_capsulatus_cf.AAC.10